MLTLFPDRFWISPYVFTVAIALEEKKLPYEAQEVSLETKAQEAPEYRKATLTARVPALAHDGFTVAESSAIVEYLEDAFPAPKHARLLPDAVKDRARARQVMSWIRSDDTLPIRSERSTHTMFYGTPKEPLSDTAKKAVKKLVDLTEGLLQGSRSTMFDAWCIADADLAFMLQRLALNGDDLPAKVRAYADANWARPSVKTFAARKRPPFVPY